MIYDYLHEHEKPILEIGFLLEWKNEDGNYQNQFCYTYQTAMEKLTAFHSQGIFPKMEIVKSDNTKSENIKSIMLKKGFISGKAIHVIDRFSDNIYLIRLNRFFKLGIDYIDFDMMAMENGNYEIISRHTIPVKITKHGLQFQFENLIISVKRFHDMFIPINT